VRRALVSIAAVLVFFAIAALVTLRLLINTAHVRALIAAAATRALGRPVELSAVALHVLPWPTLELNGVEIADDPAFSSAPFVTLDRVRLRLRVRPLLAGHVAVDAIMLERPHLVVMRHNDGRLNVTGPGAAPARLEGAAALLAARVQITGGVVDYRTQDADGRVSQFRIDALDLTVTGGTRITFAGHGRVQPGAVALRISQGSVALGGVARWGEAPVHAEVAVSAADVGPLIAAIIGPSPAMGAAVSGALTVSGTLAHPAASGDVEMTGLSVSRISPRCPEPQRRTLTFPTLKVNALWNADHFLALPVSTQLGTGTVTSSLTVTLGPPVRVELKGLEVTALPLGSILNDFLCTGYAVSGPLDLTGALSFDDAGAASLFGSGRLHIGTGEVVGPDALGFLSAVLRVGGAVSALLSADLPWSLLSSPLAFDSITATYQIADGVLTTHDLQYVSRAMSIAAGGTFELATRQIDFDLVVHHGRGEAYATVTGDAESPSIHVVPSTILRAINPGKIEQGIQAFIQGLP
jgi:AsmA family/AsmA-like C-terminal region